MKTTRRGFLGALAAAFTLDPERLLWEPGKKLISVPPTVVLPTFVPAERVALEYMLANARNKILMHPNDDTVFRLRVMEYEGRLRNIPFKTHLPWRVENLWANVGGGPAVDGTNTYQSNFFYKP